MSKFTKKNKEHLDSMVIGQGHTIMAGYIPEAVGAQTFSENYYKWKNPTPDTIAQFGFWGGDIDYNTYYPNLDKSELTPKDEEFIEPMFRLLSETIVSKNWNPTDFGQNGVLKASMKMLLGQTVNCDHETNIGNAIGAVSHGFQQHQLVQHEKPRPAAAHTCFFFQRRVAFFHDILIMIPYFHRTQI